MVTMTFSDHPRLLSELRVSLEGEGRRYELLTEALAAAVRNGELREGARLPAERHLAADLGVSRTTVVRAYSYLESMGALDRRVGSGTFVRRLAGPDRVRMLDLVDVPAEEEPAHQHKLINLSTSAPRTLPELATAVHAVVDDIVRYAASSIHHTQGDPDLRAWVAAWYTSRGLATDASQILITAGAQQALSMTIQLLSRPNACLTVETPTYLGILDVARNRRSHLLNVSELVGVEDIVALRDAIPRDCPSIIYAMPTCHTVTGHALSEDGREALAAAAADTHSFVIDDDILAEQLFDGPDLPPLAAIGDERSIVTIGGTSKLLWDGLRVGWLRAPRSMIGHLARIKSAADLGTSALSQLVALQLLVDYRGIAQRRIDEARHKLDTTCRFLTDTLPDWRWRVPLGGRSLWVQLPDNADASRFSALAIERGVAVTSGDTFSANGAHKDHLRLGFVQHEHLLDEGLVRLADAWSHFAGHQSGSTDPRS
jgi:DNA-binding transcriptional MocR family regulator